MRVIGLLCALLLFTGLTAGAYLASAQGWGLPGMLEQPVSIRQQSVSRGHGGPALFYFAGRSHRRHVGGGFRGGK